MHRPIRPRQHHEAALHCTPMTAVDVEEVAGIVHDVAVSTVLARWRALVAGEVEEKSPGELVTAVDRAAEAQLADRLRAVLPTAVVVGEEAAATDPSLLFAPA